MPIDASFAGREYPPTAPYQVSRAKIAEFAAALGDGSNPAYDGPAAIAPPTFAAVLAADAWGALFEDPDLGLSLSRTIHADQRFTWVRPLHAGDEVTAALRIDKVAMRGATAILTIDVVLAVGGDEVCRSTSTLMHSGQAAA